MVDSTTGSPDDAGLGHGLGLGVLGATCMLPGWPRLPVAIGWRSASNTDASVATSVPIEEQPALFHTSELPVDEGQIGVPPFGGRFDSAGTRDSDLVHHVNAVPTEASSSAPVPTKYRAIAIPGPSRPCSPERDGLACFWLHSAFAVLPFSFGCC